MYGDGYDLISNRKGGLNLCYEGYMYRRKAEFANTVNWVCANPNYNRFISDRNSYQYTGMCAARCITNKTGGIKLGKKGHNHPPMLQYGDDSDRQFVVKCDEYAMQY